MGLQELCLRSVAANFEASPTLSQLPENQVPKLVGLLSLELPLELAGQASPAAQGPDTALAVSDRGQRRLLVTLSSSPLRPLAAALLALHRQLWVNSQLQVSRSDTTAAR